MDAAIAKTTNDELKKLQLKLEILEEQLREAQTRADLAEEQLALYQQAEQQQQSAVAAAAAAPPPPPPPPPPPLPAKLLFAVGAVAGGDGGAGSGSLSQHIAAHNLHKSTNAKIIDNVKQQVQPQAATGMSKPPSTPYISLCTHRYQWPCYATWICIALSLLLLLPVPVLSPLSLSLLVCMCVPNSAQCQRLHNGHKTTDLVGPLSLRLFGPLELLEPLSASALPCSFNTLPPLEMFTKGYTFYVKT